MQRDLHEPWMAEQLNVRVRPALSQQAQRWQRDDEITQRAAATWRLASSPEVDGQTGVFYNQFNLGRANDQAYDVKARRELWALSLRLAGMPAATPLPRSERW